MRILIKLVELIDSGYRWHRYDLLGWHRINLLLIVTLGLLGLLLNRTDTLLKDLMIHVLIWTFNTFEWNCQRYDLTKICLLMYLIVLLWNILRLILLHAMYILIDLIGMIQVHLISRNILINYFFTRLLKGVILWQFLKLHPWRLGVSEVLKQ